MTSRKMLLPALGALAWVACIGTGFGALQRYAATAGRAEEPCGNAAEIVARYRAAGRALVVMAVHPRCPCTEASRAELGDLLARSQGTCDALLLEYEPLERTADWPPSQETQSLGGRPVRALPDPGGRLAAALGAKTSGHVVFVDATGTMRYHGGLTASRGHRGRTEAQDAILAALSGRAARFVAAPVFGCALETECRVERQPAGVGLER